MSDDTEPAATPGKPRRGDLVARAHVKVRILEVVGEGDAAVQAALVGLDAALDGESEAAARKASG